MKYKWTLLFLVHAANEQTQSHVEALRETIKGTKYNEEVKVLFLYGGLQYSVDHGYRIQVTLKEMVKGKTNELQQLEEVTPGYGVVDIGDDRILKKVFSRINEDYPSDRFLLFTWDHGSGFGIFATNVMEKSLSGKDTLNLERSFMEGNSRSFQRSEKDTHLKIITNYSDDEYINSRDFGKVKGLEKKKYKTSMLTNDELRKTITHDTSIKKVDLLIMMNCAMQMVETGYALHNAVDYLVAPETCIFWAGYNYKKIIDKVCKEPEIATEALGKYAIDTIEAYYEISSSDKYFDDLVVSMVRPAKSVAVKNAIDKIAAVLDDQLAVSFKEIKKIRHGCDDLTRKFVKGTPYQYIDLLSCIAAMAATNDKIDIDEAKQAIEDYVVHLIKGNNYRKVNEINNIPHVNGCTIYFPGTAEVADHDYYYGWFYKVGNQQTLFAEESKWKDFLISYFEYDRKSDHQNTWPRS